MQFDPEVRDYILYLFLQDLRQLFYGEGDGFGYSLEIIGDNIKKVLKDRGWPEEQLKKFKVDISIIASVAKELESDQFIQSFVNTKKTGVFIKKSVPTSFYKITDEGLQYIKKASAPVNPLKNFRP